MIFLMVFLCAWVIYLRYFYFYRQPKYNKYYCKKDIYSPAQGIVVYRKNKENKKELCICKSDEFNGKRLFKIQKYLNQQYYHQLGIFMTQYDTHYVINQVDSKIKQIICLGDNNESSMISFFDMFLSIFGIRFINWLQKSQRYIHYNQQYLIQYQNGILVVITMDKYVNKFDYEIKDNKQPYILGFVHRGSQTDIFIPDEMLEQFCVNVGDKVTYKSRIMKLK